MTARANHAENTWRWLRLTTLAALIVISWATTVYVPAVFADSLRRELGMPLEAIHGGVTVMLLANAVAAAPTGLWIAAAGVRRVLAAGSALLGLGLLLLSVAHGPILYFAAWLVCGLAAPMALGQAATAAVQQMFGDGTRRAIAVFATIGAFAPAVGWPLLTWLETFIGWRSCLALFALAHFAFCAPLAACVAPRTALPPIHQSHSRMGTVASSGEWSLSILLMAVAFGMTSFATWGLALQLVPLAETLGHARTDAVAAGALSGPVQIFGRLADIAMARHVALPGMAVGEITLMLGGVAAAILIGGGSLGLYMFVVIYGVGSGALTIVRAALPAELFPKRFAVIQGRLAAVQGIAIALGPLAGAAALLHLGPAGMLWLFGAIILVALACFMRATKLIERLGCPQERVMKE